MPSTFDALLKASVLRLQKGDILLVQYFQKQVTEDEMRRAMELIYPLCEKLGIEVLFADKRWSFSVVRQEFLKRQADKEEKNANNDNISLNSSR